MCVLVYPERNVHVHEGEAVWGVSDCEGVCGVQGVSGCIGGVCVCVKVCVCVCDCTPALAGSYHPLGLLWAHTMELAQTLLLHQEGPQAAGMYHCQVP